MRKILIITPHLSTGGLPQFLLEKILILKKKFDVYLIEWNDITGGVFVVQRNKIKKVLNDKLITLSQDKNLIFEILNKINPDILHFEEFPENFIPVDICSKIYENKKYYITETTHGTNFESKNKFFIPDKMMFVSKGNFMQYGNITQDSDVIEYPWKWRKRHENLIELNLDPSYKHVLNVGLFTPGKNQSEIFDLARRLENHKIIFHFVGNQAANFSDYWKPLMDIKPKNCIVWGERTDVDNFYKSMDLFLYTSKLENRPLSVLEAVNFDLPTLMYNLKNYADDFSKIDNIDFLTNDTQSNINLILNKLKIITNNQNKPSITAYHILTDIDSEREIKSISDLSKLEDYGIKWKPVISSTEKYYSNFKSHKKAFETGYLENPDYMLIFESDCILNIPPDKFISKINEAIRIMKKEDFLIFSFDYHNIKSVEDNIYSSFNNFIGTKAYLIPRKSYQIIYEKYQNEELNDVDNWIGKNFTDYKHGFYHQRLTKKAEL